MTEPLSTVVLWPVELNPALLEILGLPNFACAGFIPIYRAAGFDIPRRAESEQAFFIHRCVLAWAKHGEGWHDAIADEMEAFTKAAKAQADG